MAVFSAFVSVFCCGFDDRIFLDRGRKFVLLFAFLTSLFLVVRAFGGVSNCYSFNVFRSYAICNGVCDDVASGSFFASYMSRAGLKFFRNSFLESLNFCRFIVFIFVSFLSLMFFIFLRFKEKVLIRSNLFLFVFTICSSRFSFP